MTTPMDTVEIFDREDIRQIIEGEWLGPAARSGALLCPQKAGKSHILRHVYTRNSASRDTIYCQINIDYLKAGLRPTDKMSDGIFLAFFLRALAGKIQNWLAEESARTRELHHSRQKLAELTTLNGPELAEEVRAHRFQIAFCERRLTEISELKVLDRNIQELLRYPVLRPIDVAEVLFELERMNKRVVLFIDDYHQIVKQRSFSNALFSFLRGADQQKQIITLVSSQVQLMDESLHGNDPERAQLFNHFNARAIDPFDATEAENFLDWQFAGTPVLSADEKRYLVRLGGGLPYFLKISRDEFLRSRRPSSEADRTQLEVALLTIFDGAFRDIWLRCSPAKREALRQVVAESQIVATLEVVHDLEREGYIRQGKVFSTLFAEFVRRQTATARNPEAAASVIFRQEVLPTALIFAAPDEPLMTFVLRNPTDEAGQFELEGELQPYSLERRKLVSLPAQADAVIESLVVALQPERLNTLANPVRAQIRYRADWIAADGKRRSVYNDADTLLVLPIDYFIFARRSKINHQLLDYTWLIAAWVHRRERALEPITHAAASVVPLAGYIPNRADEYTQVREQVRALYNALLAHGLTYQNSTLAFHQETSDFVQRVRLPGESLRANAANCLDGCVLFASLLGAADLHPAILFVPGHAVVGWRTTSAPHADWEFIDTTRLAEKATFEQAHASGQAHYNRRRAQCDEWLQGQSVDPTGIREIKDPTDFAILVNIDAVYTTRKVVQLPAH